MTVESVTYITDLNPVNPAGTDQKKEGDNHIRNIKLGIENTFSGFTGAAITSTEAELNLLGGVTTTTAQLNYINTTTSDVQVQLDGKYVPGGTDVALVDGGTGSSTAAGARTNLELGTLAIQSTIDETDIDWANSDGISQCVDMMADYTSSSGALQSSPSYQVYIPANANSVEFKYYMGSSGANTGHAYPVIGGQNGGSNSSVSETLKTSTVTISALSGWQAFYFNSTNDDGGTSTYVKRVSCVFK